MRVDHHADEDVVEALADPDRAVANRAGTRSCVRRSGRAVRTTAGPASKPPRPLFCGEAHRQGDGTDDVIGYGRDGGEVHLSTLGRFAAGRDGGPEPRLALESAGFRWIDDAGGSIRVTGPGGTASAAATLGKGAPFSDGS
ncbi:hypothetical protein OV450_0753 [Actinobacteria bacterium OV450]|nr:hypothetical protein OV450_0753 [Actinobacteria bacterium OV450]